MPLKQSMAANAAALIIDFLNPYNAQQSYPPKYKFDGGLLLDKLYFEMSFHRQEFSPGHWEKSYQEQSTAQKFYDIEEGERMYQELAEENMWLKNQIEKNRHPHSDIYHKEHLHHKQPPPHHPANNDIVVWNMMERNRYLESKVNKLREQYEKQNRNIRNIHQSDRWRDRNQCQPETCYEGKYMQLLRVRSPFF